MKKYHPSGNLKCNYLSISQSLKLGILMEKILSISLKLNFNPNTLGCYGLVNSDVSQVGDSVVSKGRETLERAITTVHSNQEWRARVVYGDTDSLFVLVPGRSREEAFRIGAEIAETVTQENPSPVKLKLEKVYQPCILQVCNFSFVSS